jgi:hypothetical protein
MLLEHLYLLMCVEISMCKFDLVMVEKLSLKTKQKSRREHWGHRREKSGSATNPPPKFDFESSVLRWLLRHADQRFRSGSKEAHKSGFRDVSGARFSFPVSIFVIFWVLERGNFIKTGEMD